MPPRGRCTDCDGSGRCCRCYGSGANTHLNEIDPRCGECKGTGTCVSCLGSRQYNVGLRDAPIGLRLVFTIIPALFLYTVVIAGHPTRVGGEVVARPVGWLFTIAVCGPILFAIWKDVRWDDLKDLRRKKIISLFEDSDGPPK